MTGIIVINMLPVLTTSWAVAILWIGRKRWMSEEWLKQVGDC
jgi:hypothetical protein